MPNTLTAEDVRATQPALRRRLFQDDVVCPAGHECGGRGVLCAIESTGEMASFIDVAEAPTSLYLYCLGDYQGCPTWRAHRDATLAGDERGFLESLR